MISAKARHLVRDFSMRLEAEIDSGSIESPGTLVKALIENQKQENEREEEIKLYSNFFKSRRVSV